MTDPSLRLEATAGVPASLPAFKAGSRVISLDDILAAAEWRGELAPFRANREQALAAALVAEAAGRTPEPAAVEAATAEFRYARDLVSAEECDQWLEQRGLTFADLTASVTRRLLAECPEIGEPTGLPPGAGAILRTEALLADEFTDWARQLAWRSALAVADNALPSVGLAPATAYAELEARFAAAAAALAEPARRTRELAAQRLELLWVEILAAEFTDEGAAHEAFLCVREDGSTLAEVAAANGFPTRTNAAFLGELPPEWQPALLSATVGDVLPPRAGADSAVVLQLLHRREPSLADAAVTERLDREVRRQHFGQLEARHIRWLINVEVEA